MPNDELFDAKLRAVGAETDTKIARLEGKFDTIAAILGGKLDSLSEKIGEHRRDRNLIIGTIVGTGVVAVIAMGGLFIAMATYGDALFGRGMDVKHVIESTVQDTLRQANKQSVAPPASNSK